MTMTSESIGPLRMHAQNEEWPYTAPVRITGYTFTSMNILLVSLEKDGQVGRGEAAGIYYKRESAESMLRQIEAVRATIEAGVSREAIQTLLPRGGARNALDCALWDLESKLTYKPAWQIAEISEPVSLRTVFTCGADSAAAMAAKARSYEQARALKLKLTGEAEDADRVTAVREARPDVWIAIDANQGFTRESLEKLLPVLVANQVALIEQPLPIGQESKLEGFQAPIPIAADESAQGLVDVAGLVGRFNMVNIKLDKCGGLTEGLAMARRARELGLDVMVGNMGGTSLAMAPAYLVGQFCKVVDLDGPVFLQKDRPERVQYSEGKVFCPKALWG